MSEMAVLLQNLHAARLIWTCVTHKLIRQRHQGGTSLAFGWGAGRGGWGAREDGKGRGWRTLPLSVKRLLHV